MSQNLGYPGGYRCFTTRVTESEADVTELSKTEYLEALRPRYRRAAKKEKGKILSEALLVTHYHRKAIIRLLRARAEGSGAGSAWAEPDIRR